MKKIYWDSNGNLRHGVFLILLYRTIFDGFQAPLIGIEMKKWFRCCRPIPMMKVTLASFGWFNFDTIKFIFRCCVSSFRMILPSRWVRKWLLFSHIKIGDAPGPIDMWSLLQQDSSVQGGWRPKNTLLPPSTVFGEERPGHYRLISSLHTVTVGDFFHRRITLEAWINLVELYGVDGFAIAVV